MKGCEKRSVVNRAKNLSIYFHVHLVSDSTGETLVAMMRACCAQFERATPLEHIHALVRNEEQMIRALSYIEDHPGVVLYTLTNEDQRKRLEKACAELNIPAISILDATLSMLGRYLGASQNYQVAAQRTLDSDYYGRIEALDFAMAHDDGQNVIGLKNAEIVLLGVSRTSKTPTSIYLANRGYRTGNIPLVPGMPLPAILDTFDDPFIVGLVASPDRIVQIRQQRLVGLNESDITDYVDQDRVRDEMRQAKRLFVKKGYPVVDVTRRSIEETAAQIINLHQKQKRQ